MKNNLFNTKRNLCYFYIMMIIVILMVKISALGVTPGKTTLEYQKNFEREIDFSVLNNEHKDMEVFMMVQGELNSSVILYNSTAVFLPSEESKSFKARINIPDSIKDLPGIHSAEIVVMEIPKSSGGGYVGAVISVISLVHIYVLYPGKYIEADLNVLDAEKDSNITFIVPIINRGKISIGNARASIDIYTALNEKVGSVESDSSQVKSGERSELTAKWLANVNQGNYLAKVTLFYDGETRTFEKQFAIGSQALSIESIMVNNFKLGDIANLEILVENKWSQELTSVFANLLIYNTD
ncbi:MAG: hypothetical protein Q8N99_01780, partial [Nanoarchaeota archaeon]|nr:hypothetical protein [Nanoarchaeota archaeon]